jgi:hypothetical protein
VDIVDVGHLDSVIEHYREGLLNDLRVQKFESSLENFAESSRLYRQRLKSTGHLQVVLWETTRVVAYSVQE